MHEIRLGADSIAKQSALTLSAYWFDNTQISIGLHSLFFHIDIAKDFSFCRVELTLGMASFQ